jgi:hypothetical protein
MFGAFKKRGLRGAVGLITAYALVLQAFLAYSLTGEAAARDLASDAGAFFVLCAPHDGSGAQPDGGAAPKLQAHCPICTLSGSAAATLPVPSSLPMLWAVSAERTPFVSAAACISFHRARAGLSRAPPPNA